ncbi:MAG: EFR1 family ferrodoxin [Oscillospiraceae bacterium]|nr:EFR1 family ferrodoxin [Oscillospiraceae bacterium]
MIYCFTSTGNSLHSARNIAEALGTQVAPITREPATCHSDVVGLVFPAFFYGAPTIVEDFARALTITKPDAYVFAVCVSGGGAHGAGNALRRFLAFDYIAELMHVNNYIPGYSINNKPDVHAAASEQLAQIIADLKAQKMQRGRYTPINRIVRRVMPGPASDAKFKISGCTGCGICAKVCPVGNIKIDAQPQFAHRCEHCLACMHACPVAAINFGKSAGKARYIHPDVPLAELIQFYQGESIC